MANVLERLAAKVLGTGDNGKALAIGELRTVDDCKAALARVKSETADANAFLLRAAEQRNGLLLDDEAEEALIKLDIERDRTGLAIERLERLEAEIVARAEALRLAERNAAKTEYAAKYREAGKALSKALSAARAAHIAVVDIVDDARAHGFEHDWQDFLMPVPAIANLADADPGFNDWLVANGAPKVSVRGGGRAVGASQLPAPSVVPFPPRDAMRGGLVSRYGIVESPANEGPREQAPAVAGRTQIFEVAQPGEVLLSVLRAGYESPSGKQCGVGDIVAVPAGIAAQIVGRGAANWVNAPPEPETDAALASESEAAE